MIFKACKTYLERPMLKPSTRQPNTIVYKSKHLTYRNIV